MRAGHGSPRAILLPFFMAAPSPQPNQPAPLRVLFLALPRSRFPFSRRPEDKMVLALTCGSYLSGKQNSRARDVFNPSLFPARCQSSLLPATRRLNRSVKKLVFGCACLRAPTSRLRILRLCRCGLKMTSEPLVSLTGTPRTTQL